MLYTGVYSFSISWVERCNFTRKLIDKITTEQGGQINSFSDSVKSG